MMTPMTPVIFLVLGILFGLFGLGVVGTYWGIFTEPNALWLARGSSLLGLSGICFALTLLFDT